jgi:hypothetical protein
MHAIVAVESKMYKVAPDPETAIQNFFTISDKKRYDIEGIHNKPLLLPTTRASPNTAWFA